MYKGIFWEINGGVMTVRVECDRDGTPLTPTEFSSRSGKNYCHKSEWEKFPKEVTGGHPFNYYPRGRVEIKNGKATVWLNPDLNKREFRSFIEFLFCLEKENTVYKSDNSRHYAYLKDV